MQVNIWMTCDANWETYTPRILDVLLEGVDFFEQRFYGGEVERLSLIMVCREPEFEFSQRSKFYRKKRELYTDIMLDYRLMVAGSMSMNDRMNYVAEQIFLQLSADFKKRKFSDFNSIDFLADMKSWFVAISSDYHGHGGEGWTY